MKTAPPTAPAKLNRQTIPCFAGCFLCLRNSGNISLRRRKLKARTRLLHRQPPRHNRTFPGFGHAACMPWPPRTNVWPKVTSPAPPQPRQRSRSAHRTSSPIRSVQIGAAPQMAAKQPARPHHPHTGWYLPKHMMAPRRQRQLGARPSSGGHAPAPPARKPDGARCLIG
jgi:hypothetical protein